MYTISHLDNKLDKLIKEFQEYKQITNSTLITIAEHINEGFKLITDSHSDDMENLSKAIICLSEGIDAITKTLLKLNISENSEDFKSIYS